jgi:hypothetical protein
MRKLFTVFMALVLSLTYSSPVLAQSATPVAYRQHRGVTYGRTGNFAAYRPVRSLYVNVPDTPIPRAYGCVMRERYNRFR